MLLSDAPPRVQSASAPISARDIMTRRLLTLSPEMDVLDAIDRLLKRGVSGAPVVENGQFIGMFSERNALRLLVDCAYEQAPCSKIERFLDTEVHTISPDVDLLSIAQLFLHSNQRRLPVLEEDRLVGQVSRRDVLKAAHSLMQDSPNASPGSALLYLSGLREMDDAPW